MSTFNAFRPAVCEMENRALLSATLAAAAGPAEPVPYEVKLENVLVSSYQSGGHEGLTNTGPGTLTLAGNSPAAADHKGQIEIQSWSFEASIPSVAKATFKEFTITKKTDTVATITKVGTGTLEFHGVQVEGAANFHRLFGDANGDFADAPENIARAKIMLTPRKGG